MKKKSFRHHALSKEAIEKRQKIVVSSQTEKKREYLKAKRALVILALLVLATFAFGTMASWRSLPLVSGAMPQGTPPAMPANMPSREYVYAGSALISTVEPFREPPDDLAVWRPSNGTWYVLNSATQQTTTQQWGNSTDIPSPGDFDGDGKTDFCVFRESTGVWYIINSSNGANQYPTFGTSGDKPAVADFDGDGKSDIAVWRPSNQTWYIQQSSTSSMVSQAFGSIGDKAVAADYDGDGHADLAVWRDSTYTFWVKKSSDNQTISYSIGQTGDEPVIGDYDGDGKSDYAVRQR